MRFYHYSDQLIAACLHNYQPVKVYDFEGLRTYRKTQGDDKSIFTTLREYIDWVTDENLTEEEIYVHRHKALYKKTERPTPMYGKSATEGAKHNWFDGDSVPTKQDYKKGELKTIPVIGEEYLRKWIQKDHQGIFGQNPIPLDEVIEKIRIEQVETGEAEVHFDSREASLFYLQEKLNHFRTVRPRVILCRLTEMEKVFYMMLVEQLSNVSTATKGLEDDRKKFYEKIQSLTKAMRAELDLADDLF